MGKFLQKKLMSLDSLVILLTFCFWGSGTAKPAPAPVDHPNPVAYFDGDCDCHRCYSNADWEGVCVEIQETLQQGNIYLSDEVNEILVCSDKGELKGDISEYEYESSDHGGHCEQEYDEQLDVPRTVFDATGWRRVPCNSRKREEYHDKFVIHGTEEEHESIHDWINKKKNWMDSSLDKLCRSQCYHPQPRPELTPCELKPEEEEEEEEEEEGSLMGVRKLRKFWERQNKASLSSDLSRLLADVESSDVSLEAKEEAETRVADVRRLLKRGRI